MQEIDALRQEIQSFELEIGKLQQELSANSQIAPKAVSNSPEAIAAAFRSAAIATHERLSDVEGIRNAIAELNSRLQPKKVQLGELEAQELKQERSRRVEEGRSRLRAKLSDVQQAAEALKPLFFELKAIALEYEKDFAQVHPPSSGEKQLNRASLLNYEAIFLPKLTEVSDRFILHSRTLDLFEAEKESLRQERLQQSLAWRENHESQVAESKQRRVDEEMRTERQERASLLVVKRAELLEWQAARTERLSSLATANINHFDDAIAKLQTEIENLQETKAVIITE